MVEFTSYFGPMDRNYGSPSVEEDTTNDVGVGVENIGESVVMGIGAQNLQALSSKTRSGIKSMEVTFSGTGGGSGQAQTPDQYGAEKRRAIREMAEINEMDITTHASFNVMGLAGMDQQGNFSHEQSKMAVDEIKRAINFAADAASGGAVVVHTGEFQRPISEQDWAKKGNKHLFKMHEKEEETATFAVVDDRTGQVMARARRNQTVARPVWNKHESNNSYTDSKGRTVNPGDYIDYDGNKIETPFDPINGRVPKYNKDTKRFETKLYKWEDFEKEAKERSSYEGRRISPAEAYVQATLEANEGHSRGWALQYSEDFQEQLDALGKLRHAKDAYSRAEQARSPEERERLKREARDIASGAAPGMVPPDKKLPSEIIDEAIKHVEKRIEFARQSSASQEQQARDAEETRKHVRSADSYALEKSYDSYADAGMHAYLRTVEGKKKGIVKDNLFIAVENLFPESYGGHPDEVMSLVDNSRKKLAEKLHQRGLSKSEASQRANEHIKVTLDTNHLYMWRKYWQNDPNKTIDQNDKEFEKWYLGKIKDLAKKDMIGNVHLVDGYGYQDDHLSPGDGKVPIKKVVDILKKNGYDKNLVVEAGAEATVGQGHFEGVSKAWKLFDSPVYSAHIGPSGTPQSRQQWQDMSGSYFGRTAPPYFVFGGYSPSQDWSLWSQTQLE